MVDGCRVWSVGPMMTSFCRRQRDLGRSVLYVMLLVLGAWGSGRFVKHSMPSGSEFGLVFPAHRQMKPTIDVGLS